MIHLLATRCGRAFFLEWRKYRHHWCCRTTQACFRWKHKDNISIFYPRCSAVLSKTPNRLPPSPLSTCFCHTRTTTSVSYHETAALTTFHWCSFAPLPILVGISPIRLYLSPIDNISTLDNLCLFYKYRCRYTPCWSCSVRYIRFQTASTSLLLYSVQYPYRYTHQPSTSIDCPCLS